MTAWGTEPNNSIRVVEPSVPQEERLPDLLTFRYKELNHGDRFSVYHPFHGPFTVGDRSAFPDPISDAAASVLLRDLAYLTDCRKLNRVSRFETRPYASEFSQMAHCISLGIISLQFGGGILDTLDGLLNDASHVYDGHQADDNYQGHNREDLHDFDRPNFFSRAGVIKSLTQAEVLRPNGLGHYIGTTRLHIASILDEDDVSVRRSFLSNKHPQRRMDGDRFQYNEEERLLINFARSHTDHDPARVPLALAEAALQSVSRMVIIQDDEGDQLVFEDPRVAFESTMDYIGHNSEHWCEPVQDLVNDLLNLAERYFFVCDHPLAREHQYFYPRDYLHTSAHLMISKFDQVAKTHPFMKWLLDTSEKIAKDQRAKSMSNIFGSTAYAGPNPPDYITLHKKPEPLPKDAVPKISISDGRFHIELPKGKMRKLNPRVQNGKTTLPLSNIDSYGDNISDLFLERLTWIGDYDATIAIEDKELEEEIKKGLELLNQRWPRALKRTSMPDSELQRVIAEANSYVRSAH